MTAAEAVTCENPVQNVDASDTPSLWPHQVAAVEMLEPLGCGMLAMDMGCVDGAAEVVVNHCRSTRRLSLRDLYGKFHGRRWRHEFPTYLRALCGTEFRQHELRDVRCTGHKPVVRLELETGEILRLTPDHEVARPDNKWTAAELLKPGDHVVCNGTPACRECGSTENLVTWRYAKAFGLCKPCSYRFRKPVLRTKRSIVDKDGYVRLYNRHDHPRANKAGQVYEHLVVAEMMLMRSLAVGEEVHHLNGNRADNRPENLQITNRRQHNLTHRCHRHLDGGSTINGGRVMFVPRIGVIKSVTPDGETDVYDVVMADPHRNFVANGIVVHNCGKSFAAIELLLRWGCRCVLILCPKSVVRVWPAEFRKYLGPGLGGWRIVALDEDTVAERAERILTEALCAEVEGRRLAIALNYDAVIHPPLADNGGPGVLGQVEWDCLIMDESHRIKQHDGRQSELVAQLAAGIPHRLGLTGTPMPHSQLDVFAQFRAIDPELYGDNWWSFQRRYSTTEERQVPVAIPGRKGKDRWKRDAKGQVVLRTIKTVGGYQRTAELQKLMSTRTYLVRSDEVLQLPEVIDEQRYCLLGSKALLAYHSLLCDFRAELDEGEITAANALSRMVRLAQIANGYGVDGDGNEVHLGSEKAELLAEVLDDLPQGEPVVVFGRFHHDLDAMLALAKARKRKCLELSGRRNELAKWQAATGDELLAVQLQAGGVGVDFTRARYQVYFALDFNLGNYLQTRKRIHRPGQTRAVTYLHLLAAGTIDETVLSALGERRDVVDAVMEGVRRSRI